MIVDKEILSLFDELKFQCPEKYLNKTICFEMLCILSDQHINTSFILNHISISDDLLD